MQDFIVEATAHPICDFCGRPKVAWRYPANDFFVTVSAIAPDGRSKNFNWASRNDWAACNGCSGLIEANAWDDLANLSPSVRQLVGLDARAIIRNAVKELHKNFVINRKGERVPHG